MILDKSFATRRRVTACSGRLTLDDLFRAPSNGIATRSR
jgi:hypothetical protein